MHDELRARVEEMQKDLGWRAVREGFLSPGERLTLSLVVECLPHSVRRGGFCHKNALLGMAAGLFFCHRRFRRLCPSGSTAALARSAVQKAMINPCQTVGEFITQFPTVTALQKISNCGQKTANLIMLAIGEIDQF